jgi:hypothetical protein
MLCKIQKMEAKSNRELTLWRSAYRIAAIAAQSGDRKSNDAGHEALECAVCAEAIVEAAKAYAGDRR